MPHHTRGSLPNRLTHCTHLRSRTSNQTWYVKYLTLSLSRQTTDGVWYRGTMDSRLVLGAAALLCACNAKLGDMPVDAQTAIDSHVVPPDGRQVDAGLGAWTTPSAIPGANDATNAEDDCTLNS